MGERRGRKRGEEERGVGAPRLLLNLGRAERHAVHKLLAHYFNRLGQLPQADGAFKIQCLLSVPFLFQLRTQQQQLQLLTYTHGTYPNIYMYRCNTIRRLAVDPHISTVTFLIKCRRLCLCFVLVLFPNLKLWFILVWHSFFFLFELWNPIFFLFLNPIFFLFFSKK